MSSICGKRLQLSLFGESHGSQIGCVLDGLPAGEDISQDLLTEFMKLRSPAEDGCATGRRELDVPEVLSGIFRGKTTGTPLCMIIRNSDIHSADYRPMENIPRPGHADYPIMVRSGGAADIRGGGHSSGRITAALCAAGGIALQILRRRGVEIAAHILSIHGVNDGAFDPLGLPIEDRARLQSSQFPLLHPGQEAFMRAEIQKAKDRGDSVGGKIECMVIGVPVGLGEPVFDGMENHISRFLFAIPALRSVQFGDSVADVFGTENNDCYRRNAEDEFLHTQTNHAGGILGGMTTGMPLLFRCEIKPTPSVSAIQMTSTYDGQLTSLQIHGRHDVCIVPRAVPCVESAAALAVLDLII